MLVEPGENIGSEYCRLQSPLGLGLFAGKWCSYTSAPDMPYDQRLEDGGARFYDSTPLKEPLEILGAPEVELEVEADKPVAMLAIRLSDIGPDNKTTRFTYGLLNLTHRDSHEHPEPLIPGKKYTVRIKLNYVAQTIPAGNRLRVAISTSYWPMAWPSPESAAVILHTQNSRLLLPVRKPRDEDRYLQEFEPAEAAPPLRSKIIRPEYHNWQVTRDLAADISRLEVTNDSGCHYIKEIDLTISRKAEERYTYQGDDFSSVKGETIWEREFIRGKWSVRTVTKTFLASSRSNFFLRAELDAYEGDKRIYSQNWDYTIPRDLV
jgi:hypothetical protein